jgi:hypothetical protein
MLLLHQGKTPQREEAEKEAAILDAIDEGLPGPEIMRRFGITLAKLERIRKAAARLKDAQKEGAVMDALAAAAAEIKRRFGVTIDDFEVGISRLLDLLGMDRLDLAVLLQRVTKLCDHYERTTFR